MAGVDQAAPMHLAATSELPELLGRTARGDGVAFRALYQGQVRRLNGVALRITRDPALARDVLHDAFLEVWRNAGQFDPSRGSAEVWLLSVVRHRALAVMRRRRRETLGHEPAEAADEAPDALARLLATAEGTALHRCIGELDIQRQRLIGTGLRGGTLARPARGTSWTSARHGQVLDTAEFVERAQMPRAMSLGR